MFSSKREVYADYAAGAPIHIESTKAMTPWLSAAWNPSALHAKGVKARAAIESSRTSIAAHLYARPEEITFTASATESLTLAIMGVITRAKEKGIALPHVVTSAIEHSAVLETLARLHARKAIRLDILPADADGRVECSSLESLLTKETVLVSIMYANNEVGTIQPLRSVTKIVRDWKKAHHIATAPLPSTYPYVLTDACQAFATLPCHVERLGVDLLVLNSAKVGGPEGSALLYHRRGVELDPTIVGGGQERGLRSGTENVAGIVGFARAMDVTARRQEQVRAHTERLRDRLRAEIRSMFPDAHCNGSQTDTLPNILSLTFPGADHQYLALALDVRGVLVGTKSACKENDDGDSHVLLAMRKAAGSASLPPQAIRISLGWGSLATDIQAIMKGLAVAVPLARKSTTSTAGE